MMALSETDTIQIRDLAIRLYLALDAKDPAGYAAVFTPDGEFVTPFMHLKGRPEIAAFLERRIAEGMTAEVRYFVTNELVAQHPRGARFSSYLMQLNIADGPTVTGTGQFDAIAVKEDGYWHFSRLELSLDPAITNHQPVPSKK